MSEPDASASAGIDPRAKLIGVLLLTVGLTLPGPASPARLGAVAALVLLPVLASGAVLHGAFWRRLVPLVLIASGLALLVMLTRGGAQVAELPVLGVRIGRDGATAAGLLLYRTLLAGALLVALGVTTPGPDLVGALAWLRLPAPLVSVLATVGRTLGLVSDEALRMNRARELRSVRPRFGQTLRAVGGLVGSLLGRSLSRAERVHRAMVARGFDGVHLPRFRPPTAPSSPGGGGSDLCRRHRRHRTDAVTRETAPPAHRSRCLPPPSLPKCATSAACPRTSR